MKTDKIKRIISILLLLLMVLPIFAQSFSLVNADTMGGNTGSMDSGGSGAAAKGGGAPSPPAPSPPSPPPPPSPSPSPSDGPGVWKVVPRFPWVPNPDGQPIDPPQIKPEEGKTPQSKPEKKKPPVEIEEHGGYKALPMDWTGRIYGNPESLMAKSDFLMELMKTEKVEPGRMVLNRSDYSRINHLGEHKYIKTEPVETSPYQEYMGQMGIDTGQTDVVISHEVFGKVEVMSNSNVHELYLTSAYQKGLFNLNELNIDKGSKDGKQLKDYLEKFFATEKGLPGTVPRWAYSVPIRLGFAKVQVHDKVIEEDNAAALQYPQQYFKKWREVVSKQSEWKPKSNFMEGTKFWGNSYVYFNLDEYNDSKTPKYSQNISEKDMSEIDSWFSQINLGVVRRKPILMDKDGYQYFNDEVMTIMDAYKTVYKFLLTAEGEKQLSESETEYINSAYQMNMVNFLPDEVKACKYLIAKGIISGEDLNLYQAANLPLTNEVGIDLIYRVKNKQDRLKITPELNDIESAMIKRGYSQVNVSFDESDINLVPMHLGDPILDADNKVVPAEGYEDIRTTGNEFAYNYIFIRMPKAKDDKGKDNPVNFHLRVNDEYRTPIKGYKFENDGKAQLDAKGYEWRLYTVHKDTSSDLILTGLSEKTGNSYQIYGINGSGFYWIPDDKTDQKFSKWTINEFLTKPAVRSFLSNGPGQESNEDLYKQIRKILEMRTALSGTELDVKMGNSLDTASLKNKPQKLVAKLQDMFSKNSKELDSGISLASNSKSNGVTKLTEKDVAESGAKNIPEFLEKIAKDSNTGEYNSIDTKSFNEIDGSNWKRPLYGSPDEESQKTGRKDIIYGPISKDQLQALKYGDDNLAVFNGEGNPQVDPNNSLISKQGNADKYTINPVQRTKPDGGTETAYEIRFKPKTADYKNEMAKFTRHLSTGQGENAKKFPGFAQLTDNKGDPLILISKTQLEEFGIEALSDKLLYNPKTGQRAFINTDDHMTLIGNNITHYSDNEMMVNAFGAKGKHDDKGEAANKIFYNLDIILELLNDTKTVSKVAGKNIYVSKEKGSFEILNVVNRETQLKDGSDDLFIDRTYVYNTNDSRVYMNLSSLTGMTSNFIYYKNRESDKNTVDALIVYHPRDEYVDVANKTKIGLSDLMIKGKDNGLMKIKDAGEDVYKYKLKSDGVRLTEDELKQRNEAERTKAQIISKLFIGSTATPGDIIGKDYSYDIYLFEKATSSDKGADATTSFLASLFGKNSGKVFDSFKSITNTESVDIKSDKADNKFKDINLKVIKAATTEAEGERPVLTNNKTSKDYENNFLLQESTGNLYFFVGDKGNPSLASRQQRIYQEIFGQNIYYENDKIGFRMRHYYQNTPKDWIPLENYASGTSKFGSIFLSGGHEITNFELPDKSGNAVLDKEKWKYDYKFPKGKNKVSTPVNSNVAIVNSKTVGLYTKLELPYKEIPINKGLNLGGYVIDKWKAIDYEQELTRYKIPPKENVPNYNNYSNFKKPPVPKPYPEMAYNKLNNKASKDGITTALFNATLYDFDQALNKNRSQKTALDQNRTFDVVRTYKNTLNSLNSPLKRDLMQGSWDGLLDNDVTYNLLDTSRAELKKNGINVGNDSEFIVLACGTGTPIKQFPNIYNEAKDGGLYAIKVRVGGNSPRTILRNANSKDKEGRDRIKKINNLRDLTKFASEGGKQLKVFYKPALAIPQGTSLVDTKGRVHTMPNTVPREEVPYAADAINSLLFRITLKNPKYEDKTFLYQIPEGSVVDFGNGDYFVKGSKKQSDKNRLKWVNMIQSYKSSKFNIKGYEAEDFIVMSNFLMDVGNRITLGYNLNGAKIPLKSIIGKGLYVVPHKDLMEEIVKADPRGDNGKKQQLHYPINKTMWARDTSSNTDRKFKVSEYGIKPIKRHFTNSFAYSNEGLDKWSKLVMQLYMPPTIEVVKIDDKNNEADYKAVMYYDIKGFMVDKDDSYVSYLKSRDTDADEVLDEIHQIRQANLDGMKYKGFAQARFGEGKANSIRNFLLGVVPILLIFLTVMINCAYVMLCFPEVRDVVTNIGKRFGLRFADKLENGYLSPATLPPYYEVAMVSIMLVMFSILFAKGIIFSIFGRIFVGFYNLFVR